jgi:hypothetical protein
MGFSASSILLEVMLRGCGDRLGGVASTRVCGDPPSECVEELVEREASEPFLERVTVGGVVGVSATALLLDFGLCGSGVGSGVDVLVREADFSVAEEDEDEDLDFFTFFFFFVVVVELGEEDFFSDFFSDFSGFLSAVSVVEVV